MADESASTGARLTVLLVDDDQRSVDRLVSTIEGGGYAVHAERVAGLDTLEAKLREHRFDVILLSCTVDVLPAEEALDTIRACCLVTPVILMVDRGRTAIPVHLMECGAQDFVLKSNPVRLLPVIQRECAEAALRRSGDLTAGGGQIGAVFGESESRFLQLASNVPECYWMVDASSQRVSYVSSAYARIWGRYVEALYADNQDWFKHIHTDDRDRVFNAMQRARLGGLDEKFRVLRPDSSVRWLHARNFPIVDGEGDVISIGGIASDVTDLIAEHRQLSHLAHYDALTALPNQLMFYSQAKGLIALAKRGGMPLGVMVVDIDRFREIVDTFGHICGDELLRQVAGRLSGILRESDTVGRLGGDTFVAILAELSDTDQAGVVARRILEALALPVRAEGQEIFATASLGIAFYPQDGASVHELVNNAQAAMRHAKQAGRNTCSLYSTALHADTRNRLLLETDLRNALLRDEFVLYYQPKVSCANGRVIGAEALIRWRHPRRGIVPPDQFISLLEETGLIIDVGRWVLRTACRQVASWRARGLDIPSVAVNLSGRQLQHPTLCQDVESALFDSGLPPASLDLEITESMLMENTDLAISTLSTLKAMGVTLSLDDFGTGYSSLAYLKRFPLDSVKVDRSFVQDITADSDDASITRAVITMAHHLKLKVVAEGVETAGQLALLISHQCDAIQGYFFSRPVAEETLCSLLAEGKRLPANLLKRGGRKPVALFVASPECQGLVASLDGEGYRVFAVEGPDAALQWFAGNLADVLVCGTPGADFDALAFVRRTIALQPDCERILLADDEHWQQVADSSSDGTLHRIVHLPVDDASLRQMVAEALDRREISDNYNRLSHEVAVAERQLLRIEEERQRLAEENRMLVERDTQGYAILQTVIDRLPWPVVGVDDDGLLAMINPAAETEFPIRPLALGSPLAVVLPEIAPEIETQTVALDHRAYRAWWRPLDCGERVRGRLLLLQRETP